MSDLPTPFNEDECRACNGEGFYLTTVCCGHALKSGECCGNAMAGQQICEACNGSGIDQNEWIDA